MIEKIIDNNILYAILVRGEFPEEGSNFVTSEDFPLQVVLFNFKKDRTAKPHTHPGMERIIHTTDEILYVEEGTLEVWIFNLENEKIKTVILGSGDLLYFVKGGRGWKALEDSRFVEIKQGPYSPKDKILL